MINCVQCLNEVSVTASRCGGGGDHSNTNKERNQMTQEIDMLAKSADDLTEVTEIKSDVLIIVKTNFFRKSIKRKKKYVNEIEKEINECSIQF